MGKKPLYEVIIGSEFTTQPKHKPKAVPKDFLAHFYNVNPRNLEEIVEFANDHSFGGYIVPDKENSIESKFSEVYCRYNYIIEKLINLDSINYSDIEKINKDLKVTSPQICLIDEANDLRKIANNFDVYTLKNVKGEQPDITVTPIGAFDVDRKASHIKVTVNVPHTSKTLWYFDRIKDGLLNISKLFPSENWGFQEEYLDKVIFRNGKLSFNDQGLPISIEMNFWLGKTDFSREELAAVRSTESSSGCAFITMRIWDYLNTRYKDDRMKQCKICCKIHSGGSEYYCDNPECYKEWDSVRKKPMKVKIKDKLK